MLSSKCVITCKDSGGPHEFIENGCSGIIIGPNPEEMASAMDMLWTDTGIAKKYGKYAREAYISKNITWENVVEKLTYDY